MKVFKKQQGFTLIELLIVIGILGILLAIVLIALNPQRQFKQAANTQRQSDVTAILDAIHQYSVENGGNMPAGIDGTVRTVDNLATAGHVNLCTALVPTYIADLPRDPGSGTIAPVSATKSCDVATTAYSSNYTVTVANNRVTVAAPGADLSKVISVTR